MDRHQHVGVVLLREARARIQLQRRRVRARQQHRGTRVLEQRPGLEGDRERRHRLPQSRRPLRAEGWVSRVEHDGPSRERPGGVDPRGSADLEQQIATVPPGAIAPHAPRQLERDRHFVGGRLRVAHPCDQRVGAAVLHPIDVGRGAVQPQCHAPIPLGDLERDARRQRHPQGHRLRSGREAHGAHRSARRWRPRRERHDVGRAHPRDGGARQLQSHLIVPAAGFDRHRPCGEEPVVGATGHGPPGGHAVGRTGMGRVVVQDHDLRERHVDRRDRQRPARGGGVAPSRHDERGAGRAAVGAQRACRQPPRVTPHAGGQTVRRRVGDERPYAPRGFRRQRVGHQRHARSPGQHEVHRRARRRLHAQQDSLARRQRQAAHRRVAGRVDPRGAAGRWMEARRDAGGKDRATRIGPRGRGEQERRHRVVGQGDPGDPAAIGEHGHRLPVDAQRDRATRATHRSEEERGVVRLQHIGGRGVDDGDAQRLGSRRGRRGRDGREAGARDGASGHDAREHHGDRSHRRDKVASALSTRQFAE